MNYTKEQIAKAKECKSVEELLAYAKENGLELTEDEAKMYFGQWQKEGELSDEEISNVAGGSTCINGRSYSDESHGWLITTLSNYCEFYRFLGTTSSKDDGYCNHCYYLENDPDSYIYYCSKRNRWNDPLNSSIGGH